MFYYLYEIKNLVNGKIYVGVHKTRNMNDGYMGSGKVIRSAIEKYGIENFQKVILETFESSESMYAREREVVTEEFLARDDVYNLRRGGQGGFDHINRTNLNVKFGKNSPFYGIEFSKKMNARLREKLSSSKEFKEKLRQISSLGGKRNFEKNGSAFTWLNKSEEFQNKRKKKFKEIGHSQGEKNSQFGTMWITNGVANRKIKKTSTLPEGWKKGRKIP
jgi:hypothetical protein